METEPLLNQEVTPMNGRDSNKKRKVDQVLSIPVESGFQHFLSGSLDVQGVVRAQGTFSNFCFPSSVVSPCSSPLQDLFNILILD